MNLAIAEKPEVADEIVKTLSQNYEKKNGYYICSDIGLTVTWAKGNLLTLANPEYFNKEYATWNLDQLPMRWPVKFIPEPRTLKQLNIIGDLIKNASLLYNMCDIDAAGDFIFFSIVEHFNKMHLPMRRVYINDNNLIQRAWDNAKDGKEAYFNALSEKARAIADQRTGYNLSRCLTKQAEKQGWSTLLTAGRVQSVFVGIVVRRELERNCFKPSDYYNITANIRVGNDILKGVKYIPRDNDPVDESNRIVDKDFALNIATNVIGTDFRLDVIEKSLKETSRPLPYDLATLQGACDRLFKYPLDKVLDITQRLRDKKLITYNRTDSQYLNDDSFYDAPNVLEALHQVEMFAPVIDICTVDETKKSRCFNSKKVDAHHAIIPTINPSKVSELNEDEFNVYFLIFRNYVIQFMPPEIKEKVTLEFSTELESRTVRFSTTKTRQVKAGWQILFAKEPKEDEDVVAENEEYFNFDVNLLREGQTYHVVDGKSATATTPPPSLYTITSLLNAVRNSVNLVDDENIKQMLLAKDKGKPDRGGIGTAATRTPILTELFRKKLLKKSANKVRMTDASLVLYNALPASITSPVTTAIWASQQAQIQDGELSVDEFVASVEQFTAAVVHEIKQGIKIPEKYLKPMRLEECPSCKQFTAEQREGKKGKYWVCPACDKTYSDYEDKPFDRETMRYHTSDCPKCGGEAEKRIGKFGVYWKCTCGTLPDLDNKPFYELCPECNQPLKIVTPKKGKKKGPFIACSGYPDCKYSRQI